MIVKIANNVMIRILKKITLNIPMLPYFFQNSLNLHTKYTLITAI